MSSASGESHRSQASGARRTGWRLWIGRITVARGLGQHHAFGRGTLGPRLPNAGKGEGLIVAAVDKEGLLAAADFLPLIKSIGRNQTAAVGKTVAKGGQPVNGFCPGVDQ